MDVRQGWSQQIRSDYIVVRCYNCGRFFKCYGIKDEDRECELFKHHYMEDCCCNECVETDIGCICSPPLTKEEVLEEKRKGVPICYDRDFELEDWLESEEEET